VIGISALGCYVPSYCLTAESMSRVWGTSFGTGERAVANYDEDSLTMTVEATLDCLRDRESKGIDGLFFASTTAPYAEKQNASLVATAADLTKETLTVDYGGSLRAGTSALRLALDAVKSGSNRAIVVTTADCRMGEPGSAMETQLGDGAAAALVSSDEVAIAVEETFSICQEFTDVWRKSDDSHLRSEDDRFVQTHGYVEITQEAIEGLLKKAGCERQDVCKVIFYAPNVRIHHTMTRALGFDQSAYLDDVFLTLVGDTGVASPLFSLLQVLGEVKAGDRLILVGYGSGADAFLLQVTERIERLKSNLHQLNTQLTSRRLAISYGEYLKARRVIPYEKPSPFSSYPILWRDQEYDLRLRGRRCCSCDAVQYPVRRVCWQCGAKDDFEDVKLSREGSVYTYTKDYVFPAFGSPVIMAVIDLEGGGRFFTELTDCDPDDVRVGLPVKLTFRRFHEGGGFNNYYWKARPLAVGPSEGRTLKARTPLTKSNSPYLRRV